MTADEHVKRAEALLEPRLVPATATDPERSYPPPPEAVRRAQAHATIALAKIQAATDEDALGLMFQAVKDRRAAKGTD